MMFLDCPVCLDDDGERCGLPAGVRCTFTMGTTDGPLDSVMIRCPVGHWFNGPLEFLTYENGSSQGTGTYSGRGQSCYHPNKLVRTCLTTAEPEPDASFAAMEEVRYASEQS
jgi:hypothetical protein